MSLLSGCGGGGSSATTAPAIVAPSSTNVNAAYLNLVRQPHNYLLNGTSSNGATFTATLSITQGGQITYGSTVYDTAAITTSLFGSNGALMGTAVTTAWRDVGTPDWAATFSSADGTCIIRNGGNTLPTSAALATSGAYLYGTQYPGCNASNVATSRLFSVGALTQTWSYSDIGGIPFVCINNSDQETVGTVTESDCIEVSDTSGTLGTHVRVTTKDLNGVLTTLAN